MLKWFLVIGCVIGIWYGLPHLWGGVGSTIHHKLTIGDFPIRWIHVFTLIAIYAAVKVKSK